MNAMKQAGRFLIVGYSLFVVIWFLVHIASPDQWWLFILLDKLAYWFLIASVPALVLSLLTRAPLVIGLAILPVLVFSYFYYPFLIPHDAERARPGDLRVMTFNIWNQNKDVEAVLEVIDSVQPDILAIQELMGDVQAELVPRLSGNYPYHHISNEVYGGTTAIFSRHRWENVRELDLQLDRPAIIADIDFNGKRFRFAGAHLYPSYYAYHDRALSEIPLQIRQYIQGQQQQIRLLLAALESRVDLPLVLACDCNVQRTSGSRYLLEAALTDTAVTLGWQWGYHDAGSKFQRTLDHIDYLWYRGGLRPLGLYRTLRAGGSDHAPVYADFRIQ